MDLLLARQHQVTSPSFHGAVDFIDAKMEENYEILGNVLFPYTQAAYPDGGYRFQQDNDSKHKSKFTWNIVQLATKQWP